MDWIEAIVYGIVQGATEYIPVSSSAHLAIVPSLFGWKPPSFAFDVLVQLGTLGAVCVYLRDDLRKIIVAVVAGLVRRRPFEDPWARKGWLLVVATIPAVVIGALVKKLIAEAFVDLQRILIELFCNGCLLAFAELVARRASSLHRDAAQPGKPVDLPRAVFMGFGQALAILPAISRSGATIAAAVGSGVSRDEAGRFSFLMSIPVMLGAGVLSAGDLIRDKEALAHEGPALAVAFVVAALIGFLCIKWFLGFVQRHSLWGFAIYCWVVSVGGLFLMHFHGP